MKKIIFIVLSMLFVFTIVACNETTTADEIAPVVTVDTSKTTSFEYGSTEPDWTTYISATDNVDGEITITDSMVNDDNVNMSHVGSFTVLFTVSDSSGNKTLKTINISITDTTNPVITVDNTLDTEFEVGSTAPDFMEYISATDNVDGEITITADMVNDDDVDMDTVGTFDVGYTVEDYRGNEATETVTFTIVDTTKPVITQSESAQLELLSGTTEPDWTTYVTATDNYDGDITITTAMINTDDVDMDTVGTFDIIYTVIDANGNEQTLTLTITITQNDTTAPIIVVNPSADLELDLGSTAPDWTTYVTATDNVDGAITITEAMVNAAAVDMQTAGTYDLIFTVSDVAGNIATKIIQVIVSIPDTTAPVIELEPDVQTVFVVGSVEPDWTTYVTITDDIDGAITVTEAMVDTTNVDMNTVGQFDVIYTAEDARGNEATYTLTIYITEDMDYQVGSEVFNYQFDATDEGNLALPNLLEGNGYYVNDSGYAETVYMDGTNPIFGNADAWTFDSAGYDHNVEEFVLETSVIAVGQANSDTSPTFSIRIDYDWLLDVQFAFNNNSWSGVAAYNLPDGPAYSNNAETGGLAPDLNLELDRAYVFKIVVRDSTTAGNDLLSVYIDGLKVLETLVPDINANAQFIMGASAGSHLKVDYFKLNTIYDIVDYYTPTTVAFDYPFDVEDSGNLALPNLLEGSGYYVGDDGYARTVYMDGTNPVFGFADAWTFVSTGYDLGLEEYVIETSVMALGHSTADTSPTFSIRIDYDWLLDVQFSFDNNSWSGVAAYNVPDGPAYSNNPDTGGMAPNLNLALNTEYVFKIAVLDTVITGKDLLLIYVDDVLVLKVLVNDINANAQFMIGASAGSDLQVDYFHADNIQPTEYTLNDEQFNYQFDVENSGNLALPNLLEGSGYYVGDDGYARTVYMDGTNPVFGFADAWTFLSTGYDLGLEEYVIETSVMALGHSTADTSPTFSIRIDYDWLLDVQFSFDNNSWSGVAAYNVPNGPAYSNNPDTGGMAPNLNLALNTEYVFKVVVLDGDVTGEDVLLIYVDDVLVLQLNVADINANAQFIFGASAGSDLKVNYFKANLVDPIS